MTLKGYKGRILRISLTNQKASEEQIPADWLVKYIGGKGLALRYLFDELKPNSNPLGPENKLFIFTGPLAGTLSPTGSRLVIATRSPSTGTLVDSYVGGSFASYLKFAGYDGCIIEGQSEKQVYILIDDNKISINDASKLWGKTILETERVIHDLYGDNNISTLIIGPAGENQVIFSCITSESYRQAGRGGVGAVFGSKNLKGIVVHGTGHVDVYNLRGLVEYVTTLQREVVRAPENLSMVTDGTPLLVDMTNMTGTMPTRNYQSGSFKGASRIDSEQVQTKTVRRRACFSCPLGCGMVVKTKTSTLEGPEYETLALGGSNCGIADLDIIVQFNKLCDDLGLDTISTGNVIALAMELTETGRVDLGITFGDSAGMLKLVRDIAYKRSNGIELGLGSRALAKKYQASNIAMECKGLEYPGYEPRGSFGMALAYATSDRGACHMRAWPIGSEAFGKLNPYVGEGKAEIVINAQDVKAVVFSMVMCVQWGPITYSLMNDLMALVTGQTYTDDDLKLAGERIWNLARLINVREGFRRKDDYIPGRLSQEPLPADSGPASGKQIDIDIFNSMLDDYYCLRGWDSDGVPTEERLTSCGIEVRLC